MGGAVARSCSCAQACSQGQSRGRYSVRRRADRAIRVGKLIRCARMVAVRAVAWTVRCLGMLSVDAAGAVAPAAAAAMCARGLAAHDRQSGQVSDALKGFAETTFLDRRHWADKPGYTRPRVCFYDVTGPDWPVGRATVKWNEASGIDSIYGSSSSSSCPASSYVVMVGEYKEADNVYGYAFVRPKSGDPDYHLRYAAVYLNNYYRSSSTQARKTTCHELGHVLGLDHRDTSSSCMRPGPAVALSISIYPDSVDFADLKSLYAHSG